MSNALLFTTAVAPPVVAAVIAVTTEATPLEYGIVGFVLVVGLIPILRWMMSRIEVAQKESAEILVRREDREDKIVNVLNEISMRLQMSSHDSSNNHEEVIQKLDTIHEVSVCRYK